MTHTPRLHRSELAVPGSNVRMLEKAPGLGADIVMLDLEDAVAPDDKPQARLNIIDALREQDWSACSVSLRINGLDTHYCYRDIVDVVEQAGGAARPDHDPEGRVRGRRPPRRDAARPDRGGGRAATQRIGISVLIETAIGMVNVDEIATRLPGADGGDGLRRGRLRRVDAEPHDVDRRRATRDYAVLTDPTGRPSARPLGRPVALRAVADRGHLPRPRAAPDRRPVRRLQRPRGLPRRRAAGRGAGLRGQVGDPSLADHARQRGLHPRRRTSSRRPTASSRRCSDAAANGKGAVSLDGRLIDAASIRMAETLLAKLEQIEAKENGALRPARGRRGGELEERRVARDRVLAPFADI